MSEQFPKVQGNHILILKERLRSSCEFVTRGATPQWKRAGVERLNDKEGRDGGEHFGYSQKTPESGRSMVSKRRDTAR